jgi:hypothetical protein
MADKHVLETELLKALVQVGQVAQQLLALRDSPQREADEPAAVDTSPAPAPLMQSSRPTTWTNNQTVRPRFFSDHAATRLQERYDVPFERVGKTMAHISHQIMGTHYSKLEALDLGRANEDEYEGILYAVDIFGSPGFVIAAEDDGFIITVLPRSPWQLDKLSARQEEDLESFRTELQCRAEAYLRNR